MANGIGLLLLMANKPSTSGGGITSAEILTIETNASNIVKNSIMDNGTLSSFKVVTLADYTALGTTTSTDNIVYLIRG